MKRKTSREIARMACSLQATFRPLKNVHNAVALGLCRVCRGLGFRLGFRLWSSYYTLKPEANSRL